jgi:HD-GYP domain-containing protein (c-di-GMP phosphodiesterase class II)
MTVYIKTGCEHLKIAAMFLASAAIAAQHHERPDGAGYMCASETSVYSKLVAVADVFDALISKRAYKEPWPPDDVFTYMQDGVGTQFDGACIKLLLAQQKDILAIYD